MNPIFLGCYNKNITYLNGDNNETIPMSQIETLIKLSSTQSCIQTFNYDCNLAPLANEHVDLAYWEDRHGEINTYFTGNKTIGIKNFRNTCYFKNLYHTLNLEKIGSIRPYRYKAKSFFSNVLCFNFSICSIYVVN